MASIFLKTVFALTLTLFSLNISGRQRVSQALSADKIQEIKKSLVFIQTPNATGSGFVFNSSNNRILVMTNYHVIEDIVNNPIKASTSDIKVILNSGTSQQKAYSVDSMISYIKADLAVLAVNNVKDNVPILKFQNENLYETMDVYAFGFPFGRILDVNQSPAPTILKSRVSSFRMSHFGELDIVQLDANFNPGNSGGPVVSEHGNVVGIAVATIIGTDISFMIPSLHAIEFLEGTLDVFNITSYQYNYNKADEISLTLIPKLADPFGKITKIGLNELSRNPSPNEIKPPFKSLGDTVFQQTVNDQLLGWKVTLSTHPSKIKWYQPWYVRKGSNKRIYLPPFPPGFEDQITNLLNNQKINTPKRPNKFKFDQTIPEDLKPNILIDDSWNENMPTLNSEITILVPGRIEHLTTAAAGRYLVCKLENKPILAILDFLKKDFVKFFIMTPDSIFTAGGNKLVIYETKNNLLKIFNLQNFKLETEIQKPLEKTILTMGMGSSNHRRLFLTSHFKNKSQYFLFDLKTHKMFTLPVSNYFLSQSDHSFFVVSNSSGSIFTIARKSNYFNSGLIVNTDINNRTKAFSFQSNHEWYQINQSGILTSSTFAASATGKELFKLNDNMRLFTSENSNIGIVLIYDDQNEKAQGFLVSTLSMTKIAKLKTHFNYIHPTKRNYSFQRVIFYPKSNFFAIFSPHQDKIKLVPLNWEELMLSKEEDYAYFESTPLTYAIEGQPYTYQAKVLSSKGLFSSPKFELIDAPEGMKLSKKGKLFWEHPILPEGNTSSGHQVKIKTSIGKSGEDTQSFKLVVFDDTL